MCVRLLPFAQRCEGEQASKNVARRSAMWHDAPRRELAAS